MESTRLSRKTELEKALISHIVAAGGVYSPAASSSGQHAVPLVSSRDGRGYNVIGVGRRGALMKRVAATVRGNRDVAGLAVCLLVVIKNRRRPGRQVFGRPVSNTAVLMGRSIV